MESHQSNRALAIINESLNRLAVNRWLPFPTMPTAGNHGAPIRTLSWSVPSHGCRDCNWSTRLPTIVRSLLAPIQPTLRHREQRLKNPLKPFNTHCTAGLTKFTGVGADSKTVLEILRDSNEREKAQIDQTYRTKYGTTLEKELKGQFSGADSRSSTQHTKSQR